LPILSPNCKQYWNYNFEEFLEDKISFSVKKYNLGTGCSIWKIDVMNGCISEGINIWTHVGKAKMCLRNGSFLKNCKQTAEKCKQILGNQKNLPPGFTNMGWNIDTFKVLPFKIFTFQMEHPTVF